MPSFLRSSSSSSSNNNNNNTTIIMHATKSNYSACCFYYYNYNYNYNYAWIVVVIMVMVMQIQETLAFTNGSLIPSYLCNPNALDNGGPTSLGSIIPLLKIQGRYCIYLVDAFVMLQPVVSPFFYMNLYS